MDTTTAATTNSSKQSTGSTPESLRARFALLQQSAVFTAVAAQAALLKWDRDRVLMDPASLHEFLRALNTSILVADAGDNESDQAQFRTLWDATIELRDDVIDWHCHADDDRPNDFPFDARLDLGVSR